MEVGYVAVWAILCAGAVGNVVGYCYCKSSAWGGWMKMADGVVES
jgi:hypothetical protein